jgi:signal transduction histidine kinase
LVAGVTHEINTPLGTLRSATDTLRRIGSSTRQPPGGGPTAQPHDLGLDTRRRERSSLAASELLELITSSADRLHQLVRRLERYANVDRSSHQALDLRESIASALAVLGPGLTPQIVVRERYGDADLSLYGDRAKLGQLFWNLLQNAITALNGRGEITISARRSSDRIELELADTGVGIAPERMPELFNFGFTQKSGRIGLRLGLPTSKLTVAELGGEISIESVPGQGTSVRVSLPVQPLSSSDARAALSRDSMVVSAHGVRYIDSASCPSENGAAAAAHCWCSWRGAAAEHRVAASPPSSSAPAPGIRRPRRG